MSDAPDVPTDASIGELTDRLERIIEQLEAGEVSLERAQELHAEGQVVLEQLEDALDIGEGSVEIQE